MAALLVVGVLAAPAVLSAAGPAVAGTTVYSGGVDFLPNVQFRRATVTVSGNGKTFNQQFEAGDSLSIGVFDSSGQLLPDGVYKWQLDLIPDAATARELRIAASLNGGRAPNAWQPLSGTFAIVGGSMAIPEQGEAGSALVRASGSTAGLQPGSGLSLRGFARAVASEDDDAAVGSRADVESEMRAAAARAESYPGAQAFGLVQPGRTMPERTDAGALATGGSLESAFVPRSPGNVFGAAKPAPRSIDPDGKNGRPRSRDELR